MLNDFAIARAHHTKQLTSLVGSGVAPTVTLLSDGELDTLALGQGDPGLLEADDEDVALTGGEDVVNGVLQVDDVEASIVALTVGDDTDTTHVASTGDHGDGASVEPDEVGDLAGGEIDLDGVVDLDLGVGVTDAVISRVSNTIRKNGRTSRCATCAEKSPIASRRN